MDMEYIKKQIEEAFERERKENGEEKESKKEC